MSWPDALRPQKPVPAVRNWNGRGSKHRPAYAGRSPGQVAWTRCAERRGKQATRPAISRQVRTTDRLNVSRMNRFVVGCVKMREAARKRSQATAQQSAAGLSGTEDDHADRFLQERLRFERPDVG